jgi:hypothetical protein
MVFCGKCYSNLFIENNIIQSVIPAKVPWGCLAARESRTWRGHLALVLSSLTLRTRAGRPRYEDTPVEYDKSIGPV